MSEKEDLAQKLLILLEQEYGKPVQLRVDLPESQYCQTGKKYYGSFQERPLEVNGIANLHPKYEHDLFLIEGNYANLAELQQRIQKYNILYNFPLSKTVEKRINYQLREENYPLGLESLAANMCQGKISPTIVKHYLEHLKISYLQHFLTVRTDGVYDDRTEENNFTHGQVLAVREFKIAEIILKRISKSP